MHDRDHIRRGRRSRLGAGVAALAGASILIAGCGGAGSGSGGIATTTDRQLVIGTTQNEAVGVTVAGIKCETTEQVLFHIHAHLAVFVNGRPGTIPPGIGIAPPRSTEQTPEGPFVLGGSCFYWLHSHTADGIIHIESPLRRTFTLGDYFAVWNQPLNATRVGQAKGRVTAYANGRAFTGNPRSIPLGAQAMIQLDVGTVVAPHPYTFPKGL